MNAVEFMDVYMIIHIVINNYIPAGILVATTIGMLVFVYVFTIEVLVTENLPFTAEDK